MAKQPRYLYDKTAFLSLLERRGIDDPHVLQAMAQVPREAFVGEDWLRNAYDDSPLPIEAGQTISQPYIVARMIQALALQPADRVLEIGSGSGYASAILAELAAEVWAIERQPELLEIASKRLRRLGYRKVHLRRGDGTRGWPEHGPYDAILVSAGGPKVPASLIAQLAPGGRLVMPVGDAPDQQSLLLLTRGPGGAIERENLGEVRFVPLIGKEGWEEGDGGLRRAPREGHKPADEPRSLPEHIRAAAESFGDIDSADLGPFIERIGDARLVLLGEASHGTAEFYEMRARISRELIVHHGFRLLAVEADWPDASKVDNYVRGGAPRHGESAFTRFPTWMWANRQVLDFLRWLRGHNEGLAAEDCVGFFGLDLYSLYGSMDEVIRYLEGVDPEVAAYARERYACLAPWRHDPSAYAGAALRGRHESCERDVVAMLDALLRKRLELSAADGRAYLDALGNARLVRHAEAYYRALYQGSVQTWNLRDRHMFSTLEHLLDFHGPDSRAIVWAHNSHLGDARATEMHRRGELNLGCLCRERFGRQAYLVGFGTHAGSVAAASDWGGPLEIKELRPSLSESYERQCHDSGVQSFLLGLHGNAALRELLEQPRLERAIGVIYRPETEPWSHYFEAVLPRQFDEYVWFNQTRAVEPLMSEAGEAGEAETFPFGL